MFKSRLCFLNNELQLGTMRDYNVQRSEPIHRRLSAKTIQVRLK
jgi:hypothetical protein